MWATAWKWALSITTHTACSPPTWQQIEQQENKDDQIVERNPSTTTDDGRRNCSSRHAIARTAHTHRFKNQMPPFAHGHQLDTSIKAALRHNKLLFPTLEKLRRHTHCRFSGRVAGPGWEGGILEGNTTQGKQNIEEIGADTIWVLYLPRRPTASPKKPSRYHTVQLFGPLLRGAWVREWVSVSRTINTRHDETMSHALKYTHGTDLSISHTITRRNAYQTSHVHLNTHPRYTQTHPQT